MHPNTTPRSIVQEAKEESKQTQQEENTPEINSQQQVQQTYFAPRDNQSAFMRSSKRLSSTADRYAPQVALFLFIIYLFSYFLFGIYYFI
jgi:hypothetical protein